MTYDSNNYQPSQQGYPVQQPQYGGGGYMGYDEDILVDMGIETTGGVAEPREIVPVGTHVFQVQSFTRDVSNNMPDEPQIILSVQVVKTDIPEATGKRTQEWLTVPGLTRKEQDYKTWQSMMKMLRMKVEAVTGVPHREDNLVLRPREWVGKVFIASVTHVTSSSPDKNNPGQFRQYTNSNLNNWQYPYIAQQPQQATLQGAMHAAGVQPPAQGPQPAAAQPMPAQGVPPSMQQMTQATPEEMARQQALVEQARQQATQQPQSEPSFQIPPMGEQAQQPKADEEPF